MIAFSDKKMLLRLISESCFFIQSSMKTVPEGPIYNKGSLVQTMAWHTLDGKSLSEAMMALFTEQCKLDTQLPWVDSNHTFRSVEDLLDVLITR